MHQLNFLSCRSNYFRDTFFTFQENPNLLKQDVSNKQKDRVKK